ncbi:hypothetical protein [Noviherbaspirillum denitrificans]|nr:hypothetical protein [Noviherbaspirillum denitrificans]
MAIYLAAIVLSLAATTAIVGSCMFNASATRAAPVNIVQFK